MRIVNLTRVFYDDTGSVLGDIVGRAAQAVIDSVSELRAELQCDFVIANCENAAGGWATPICDGLLAAGIDVLTTGNHAFDKSSSPYMATQPVAAV